MTIRLVRFKAPSTLDHIAVKGKNNAAHIFALLGTPTLKQSERFQQLLTHHQEMLEAYRTRQWAKARFLLNQCIQLNTTEFGLTTLYDLYSQRILACTSNPPPAYWNGVYEAASVTTLRTV